MTERAMGQRYFLLIMDYVKFINGYNVQSTKHYTLK